MNKKIYETPETEVVLIMTEEQFFATSFGDGVEEGDDIEMN